MVKFSEKREFKFGKSERFVDDSHICLIETEDSKVKAIVNYESLVLKTRKLKFHKGVIKPPELDTEKYNRVVIKTEYLERVMSILKRIGSEEIVIYVANDYPLVLFNSSPSNDRTVFYIAPRIA